MRKKNISIPVNSMANEFGIGISVERLSFNDLSALEKEALNNIDDGKSAHRHNAHSFFLLESGTVDIEIDFQKYTITAPSVMYVHPDQVHRTIASDDLVVSSWAITNENLNPEYLELLEGITPAKPLALQEKTFALIYEAVSLFMKFFERKNDKLYHDLLKDSCNALLALVASQYLALNKKEDKFSRFEIITKEFKQTLERNYISLKRPSAYAEKLNISTPYLNECVKNTTGHSVTHHLQQRIILEAKRLLYHSDKTVKEIAAELGYDDYPYFSRLFTKVTGMTALTFRNKNHD